MQVGMQNKQTVWHEQVDADPLLLFPMDINFIFNSIAVSLTLVSPKKIATKSYNPVYSFIFFCVNAIQN